MPRMILSKTTVNADYFWVEVTRVLFSLGRSLNRDQRVSHLGVTPIVGSTQGMGSTGLGLRDGDECSFLSVLIVEFFGFKYSVHYSLIDVGGRGRNCGGVVCG